MADQNRNGWIGSEASRRAKSAVAVAISFIVLVSGLGFASYKGYSVYMDWRQQDDYIGNGDQPVQIVIQNGDGWANVADLLMAQDVIKDPSLFETEALKNGPGPSSYGTWNLKTHLPAATAAAMLNDPKNKVILRLTIKEGLRMDQIEPILMDSLQVTQDQINQALAAVQNDPSVIGLNPAAGNNPEGFLFPDTYLMSPPIDTTVTNALTLMAKEFNNVSTELNLDGKAQDLGLTTQQVVVIASIIESEVNNADDRPKVARAILNRLKAGMPLGVESAFRYGRLMADGTPYDDPITAASQQDASLPYNYYINTGLPAVPISNPSKEALQAAVNPADGDWLYWVTVNLKTGETQFASDEAGYQALEDQLKQWCSDNGEPTGCS
ncbi:MAG: endolytic transglycosylase MltG [Propionibacteriaceae bacterium]|nr:endolytic transglycosylase MltG [Propionibacteriaceae bacterium]